jgi:hypothetical protein
MKVLAYMKKAVCALLTAVCMAVILTPQAHADERFRLLHGSSACAYGHDSCGAIINGVLYTAPINGAFNVSSEFAAVGSSSFYQYATSFSNGVGSNQTWTSPHPWAWNAPGVDINVGYDITVPLKDPTAANMLPGGCSIKTTTSALNTTLGNGNIIVRPELYCSGITGIAELAHFVLGRNAAAGFPNGPGNMGCIAVVVGGNVLGTVAVHDNDFENGPGSNLTGANAPALALPTGSTYGGCVSTVVYGYLTLASTNNYPCSSCTGVLTVTGVFYGGVYHHTNSPLVTVQLNYQGNDGQAGNIDADAAIDAANGTQSCGTTAAPAACTGNGGVGTYHVSAINNTASFTSSTSVSAPQNFQIGIQNSGLSITAAGAGSGPAYSSQQNVEVYNNVFNGHGKPTETVCGGGPCDGFGFGDFHAAGWRTVAYNAFLNMPARPMGGGDLGSQTPDGYYGVTANGATYWGNYIEGISENPYGVHGELIEDGGYQCTSTVTAVCPTSTTQVSLPSVEYGFNVVMTPNYPQSTTAGFYLSTGADNNYIWSYSNIHHNVMIYNQTEPSPCTPPASPPAATPTCVNASVGMELGHLNNYQNIVFNSNFMDVGVPATIPSGQTYGTTLGCFSFLIANGQTVKLGSTSITNTVPTTGFAYTGAGVFAYDVGPAPNLGASWNNNISMTTGRYIGGFNVALGTTGCN